eukprot:TRINITY_DN27529_c0_g1_i2.p1 TRINITY_DN27529_c0_g1~~TRINITY_DN27529_c0_g1_i2.p1  ORF type:complete len:163 (+),score=28.49 TRINITY_DN27529_c0_g1_i2:152-640(+)
MLRSLVGSEMCIRDSCCGTHPLYPTVSFSHRISRTLELGEWNALELQQTVRTVLEAQAQPALAVLERDDASLFLVDPASSFPWQIMFDCMGPERMDARHSQDGSKVAWSEIVGTHVMPVETLAAMADREYLIRVFCHAEKRMESLEAARAPSTTFALTEVMD